MKYLSLFSGGGGGEIACEHLLGWKCVGRAEWDEGARSILAHRANTGHLGEAPLWADVREVPAVACDVVVGGFPCQPFSSAGRRLADDDPRNGWPWMLGVVDRCAPRYVWGENVRGLLSSGYFGEIVGSLVARGYAVQWKLLGAADVGALHRRRRLWIVASPGVVEPTHAPCAVLRGERWVSAQGSLLAPAEWGEWPVCGVASGGVAWALPAVHGADGRWPTPSATDHKGSSKPGQRKGQLSEIEAVYNTPTAVNADAPRRFAQGGASTAATVLELHPEAWGLQRAGHRLNPDWVEWLMGWPVGWTDTARAEVDNARPLHLDPHPEIARLAPRQADHVRRLKALGNGWVPQCGAAAWRMMEGER